MKALGFWGEYGQHCWLDAPCKNSGWCFKSLGVLNASGLKKLRPESNSGCTPKKKTWMPYDALQNLLEKHDAAQPKTTEPEKILPAVTVHRRPGGFHGSVVEVSWLYGHPMGNHSDSQRFPAG